MVGFHAKVIDLSRCQLTQNTHVFLCILYKRF